MRGDGSPQDIPPRTRRDDNRADRHDTSIPLSLPQNEGDGPYPLAVMPVADYAEVFMVSRPCLQAKLFFPPSQEDPTNLP